MARTVDGNWITYGGGARIALAIVLIAVAAATVYAGARLRRPVRLPRASQAAMPIMALAWLLALVAFLVCFEAYVAGLRRHHLLHGIPSDPITPVTAVCVLVFFMTVLIITGSEPGLVRVASAAAGALAAPMFFEFPFDLMVMTRTYPPIPPDPAAYRVLFFAPLFLVEFLTLSLLTFAPMARLRRATFFSFALMLAVFAVWALDGLAYPVTPAPYALNVLGKVIAFAAALTLFLPPRRVAGARPRSADVDHAVIRA
jgi:hypothetical protein